MYLKTSNLIKKQNPNLGLKNFEKFNDFIASNTILIIDACLHDLSKIHSLDVLLFYCFYSVYMVGNLKKLKFTNHIKNILKVIEKHRNFNPKHIQLFNRLMFLNSIKRVPDGGF